MSRPLFTPDYLRVCLATLCFFAASDMLLAALPVYFAHLKFAGLWMGVLVSAFMATSLVARPWAGKLVDETGRKKLLLAGAGLFAIGVPFLGALANPGLLFALRILQGGGYALFYTAAATFIVQRIPAGRKAEGLSHFSNAMKIATAFSPALSLWLIGAHHLSWVFPVAAAFGLAALLCLAGLSGSIANTDASPEVPGPPKAPGRLFHPASLFPGLVMASNAMVFGALIPFIPLIAAEKHVMHPGWFYTLYAVFLILSRTGAGRAADALGRAAVAIPGLFMVCLSVVALAVSSHDAVFLGASALYGLAAGTVQPALMAFAVDRSDARTHGAAMATFTLLSDAGIALGSFLVGVFGAAWGYGNTLWLIVGATGLGAIVFTVRCLPALRAGRLGRIAG